MRAEKERTNIISRQREKKKDYSEQVSWNFYKAFYSTRNRHMKPVIILKIKEKEIKNVLREMVIVAEINNMKLPEVQHYKFDNTFCLHYLFNVL